MKLLRHAKIWLFALGCWLLAVSSSAQSRFGDGQVKVRTVARNAVRIQYTEGGQTVTTQVDKTRIPVFLREE